MTIFDFIRKSKNGINMRIYKEGRLKFQGSMSEFKDTPLVKISSIIESGIVDFSISSNENTGEIEAVFNII